jgi:hypothetical protein
MKKIILGVCLLSASTLMCTAVYASDMTAPFKVRSAFHHEYKDATAPVWILKEGKWDVSFKKGGNVSMTASYNWSGHRIDSWMAVEQSAVPTKVIDQLKDKYPEGYSHEFTKIQRPWKRDLYLAKVKEKGSFKSLYLDKNGHEFDYASR